MRPPDLRGCAEGELDVAGLTIGPRTTAGAAPLPAALRDVLRCPACASRLEDDPPYLRCDACRRLWPVDAGVPDFGGIDPRVHDLTAAERWDVTHAAESDGWDVALHDLLRSIDRATYRRAVDEYQAQWRFVVPLAPGARVVDLNAGWGAVAFGLADACGLVVAADGCLAQAAFIATRARQSGRDRVAAVRVALDAPLPLASASFDAVVLNDAVSRLPADEQLGLLRRARPLLRPGGALFLADVNRLSPGHLTGSHAHRHPRTLAGYLALLRAAGFLVVAAYAPLPSHLEPFFLAPLDDTTALAYLLGEILAGQDLEAHLRARGLGRLYHAARLAARVAPTPLLAALARAFVPSVALVGRV